MHNSCPKLRENYICEKLTTGNASTYAVVKFCKNVCGGLL